MMQDVGMERFQEALRSGRKIEAIKIYREIHGVGLKQAKEAVERLAADGEVGMSSGHRSGESRRRGAGPSCSWVSGWRCCSRGSSWRRLLEPGLRVRSRG